MQRTNIAYVTDTWNPVTGCTPVSIGCEHCYAARMAKRLAGRYGYPKDDPFKVTCHPERLNEPMKHKKPCRIFVCSMSDLFHEDVPFTFLDEVFDIMITATRHDYMILTKRPHEMSNVIGVSHCFEPSYYTDNLWLGITAENQETWEQRKEPLKELSEYFPVFVSAEPLLGPVDMGDISWLSWLIVGGETGPQAREMKGEWLWSLSKQARESNVSYFFKQWGDNYKKDYIHDSRTLRQYPDNMRVRES